MTRSNGDNQAFSWDDTGNRLTATRAGQGSTYTPSPNTNRLSTVTGAGPRSLGYNADGSVHTDSRTGGTYTYGYDVTVREPPSPATSIRRRARA